MFVYTLGSIINCNRITRVYVSVDNNKWLGRKEPKTTYQVLIEMSDGLTFNEWDGQTAPHFKTIAVTHAKEGIEWSNTCYALVKALFTAMGDSENFNVDEWLAKENER